MPFERGPYLTTAVFCEQVLQEASGVLSLIRIVDRMNVTASGPHSPEEMPPQKLGWTLVITLKSGDARGSHPVKIVPQRPSGETMPPITLSVHLEGDNKGANLVAKMDMQVEMPGIYWFNIYVDDYLITRVPFELIYSRIVTPGLPKPPSPGER
jgi:hypothetical protein